MADGPDPRFAAGDDAVLVDTSNVAFAIVLHWDGACDMRAQIEKPEMARHLRYIADQLDPPEGARP